MKVTLVEIDLPFCLNTYGIAPCTAALGVTGDIKCFNSLRTCQDRQNFNAGIKTLRFCQPSMDIEFRKGGSPVVVIPSIDSVNITPAVVNPGVDIGLRETVRVSFRDHPHSDAGLDKYLSDRDYDPFERGTFWGKLCARYPSFEGYALRVLRGEYGDDLNNFTTYHYVIDALTEQGDKVTVTAKDPLILTDKKRAQAPYISTGVLASDIDESAGSLTLSPAGIGDAEYPSSGKATIGGKEIVSFTRIGDTVTLTARGENGTEPDKHDEGDLFQLVLEYTSQPPSAIIADLLSYVPGFDPSWITISDWQRDVDDYLGRLYSAVIAEPVAVADLLNELIEQIGLVMYWDAVNQQLRLIPLRPVTATAVAYCTNRIEAGSFKLTHQPNLRVSEVWTYYGQRNPLEPLDERQNYKVAVATADAEALEDYPQPAIKQIFSRWIVATNRAAASGLNAMILSRYRDAPRKFSFVIRDEPPMLAQGIRVKHWHIQDETGAEVEVPAQVISVEPRDDSTVVVAQEAVFVEQDDGGSGGAPGPRYIYIDSPAYNINLRTLYDEIYVAPQSGDEVVFVVNAKVGGLRGSSAPSLTVGDWPSGVLITVRVNARIAGRGGRGGGEQSANGGNGGTALYTRFPITIENNDVIAGGGGGGAKRVILTRGGPVTFQGSGGAGNQPGLDGIGSASGLVPATETAGGFGPSPGGDPGQPGNTTAYGTGGAAGIAVDGDSYITWSVLGTIIGPRVN